MAIAFMVVFYAGLYLAASTYFAFAFDDTHRASSAPTWLVRAYAILFVLLVLAVLGNKAVNPVAASNALMVATGLLFGPALAPPFRPHTATQPSWWVRIKVMSEGLATGAVVRKVAAFIVFSVALLLGDQTWLLVAFGLSGLHALLKAAIHGDHVRRNRH